MPDMQRDTYPFSVFPRRSRRAGRARVALGRQAGSAPAPRVDAHGCLTPPFHLSLLPRLKIPPHSRALPRVTEDPSKTRCLLARRGAWLAGGMLPGPRSPGGGSARAAPRTPGAPGPAAGSERHPAGLSVGHRLHPSPTRPPERATAPHSEGQRWPARHPALHPCSARARRWPGLIGVPGGGGARGRGSSG